MLQVDGTLRIYNHLKHSFAWNKRAHFRHLNVFILANGGRGECCPRSDEKCQRDDDDAHGRGGELSDDDDDRDDDVDGDDDEVDFPDTD